ncbi:MAG: anaerobic ribonucleoside-triphosphate reductase [Candidatus Methanoliparum thermophilum]|uniref:Anaerobic ribonucleoside-triphosphate reductase n=1 Tax=Methanoliparum thermophilum TaxID=2491083 RepID=A0A520KSI7_METT2|nr:MAG: anaerobic ribonucleoside-triphosphate reductase [Candidatus Methanoliparum thermophilum]
MKTKCSSQGGAGTLVLPDVRTTDGHILKWDRTNIVDQLVRETKLAEEFYGIEPCSKEEAEEIAIEAEKRIKKMQLKFLSGPLIREIVNIILLERGRAEWRNVLTRVGMPVYDAHEIDYGNGFEARENANLQNNAETSHKKKADKICKEQYLLSIPQELADLHLSGNIHIHDLEYFGTRAFCQDWDLRYFLYYGLMPDGVGTKSSVAGPAKRPEVAVLHAVKALGSAQTNFAGGQGFYNFLTFLAPYFENLEYDEIKQLMQMFTYEMTQMMVARGGQIVFSSVQLTPGVPKIWRDVDVVYKGKIWHDKKYKNFEREVRLSFKALMEVMLEGDYWGKPFNFPKPEISLEKQFLDPDDFVKKFDKDHPDLPTYDDLYDLSFQLAAKFGTPYFDNQLPEYRGGGEGISCYQCCAYQFNSNAETDSEFNEKIRFENGKHFNLGSLQVISLNCPWAAYNANGDDNLLFNNLYSLMDKAAEIFKIKWSWIRDIVSKGRMPFATQRPDKSGAMAVDIDKLVCIIGVVGINEMVQYHTGYQLHESEDAVRLAVLTMNKMKIYCKELSKKYGFEIVLARTPAETCAQRFAVSDLIKYGSAIFSVLKGDVGKALDLLKKDPKNRDLPIYYTNGTHVSESANIDLFKKIKIEEKFFPILDGGNIFHIFLGEKAPNPKGLKSLTLKIAKNTPIGYFAFTKDMTICLDDYTVSGGILDSCPVCGGKNLEYLSRVTGYLQAVSGWNEAKKEELRNRHRYNI